jgi:3D (Asp-Asp-Asp) domain-containing protein
MRTLLVRVLPAVGCVFIVGCSTRSLPKYEKPLARAAVMNVRTTAYTHTEGDHIEYGSKNALGTTLQSGQIHSAAADWSRWPAGSIFRIRETGEVYQVDDYGWALSGTNTIDLYKPSRAAMNAWGVRRVTIENLRWGDPRQSLAILRQRSKFRHVKRMADELENRIADWDAPTAAPQMIAAAPIPQPATPTPRAIPVAKPAAAPTQVAMAQPARPAAPARPTGASGPTGTTATREAFLNSVR